MNTVELIDKKEQLIKDANELLSTAQSEERELNEEEQAELEEIKEQIAEIDKELDKKDDNEPEPTEEKAEKEEEEERSMNKFSLVKAIRSIADKRQLDESAQAVINVGKAEMRKSGLSFNGQIQLPVEERADVQATVATAGQEVVAEEKLNILDPLRDNLVLAKAGATILTGLVGDVSIPTYAGTSATWKGEIEAADDGAGEFGEVLLTPKRLTTKINVSKQFLIQDSAAADEMLRRDIINAITDKLQATILGDAAGTANQPAGIFNGAGSISADYKDICELEAELENNKVFGDYTYIVSPSVKATLRSTIKGTNNTGMIFENGEIDGTPAYVAAGAKGIVVGNFADYVIAQWGAIDLTVDPYTLADQGEVRLVVNAYFDAKPRRAEAIVAKTIAEN